MNRFFCGCLGLALYAVAARAFAQDEEAATSGAPQHTVPAGQQREDLSRDEPLFQKQEGAPAGAVHVFVTTGEDDLLLTVAQPGARRAIVRCYRQCSFWGVPGSYALWATSAERQVHYQTILHVEQRTSFTVSSGHPDARTAGLIAGIVGPIAVVAGVVLLGYQFAAAPQCDSCPPQGGHPVPVALAISGLAATFVGWGLFVASGPRVDTVDDKPIRSVGASHLHLGVLAFPRGGWGGGLSTQF